MSNEGRVGDTGINGKNIEGRFRSYESKKTVVLLDRKTVPVQKCDQWQIEDLNPA